MLIPPPEDPSKLCLVVDLDETLVHAFFSPIENPDFSFSLETKPGELVMIYILIRPGAKEFLQKLGSLYEIVIFTASFQPYADYVIDQIDTDNVVKYRLYKRSCTDYNGCVIKDLSLLNRSLSKIILVDNSSMTSLLQPHNVIVCNTWTDDLNDRQLFEIQEFLTVHANDSSVYPFLKKKPSK